MHPAVLSNHKFKANSLCFAKPAIFFLFLSCCIASYYLADIGILFGWGINTGWYVFVPFLLVMSILCVCLFPTDLKFTQYELAIVLFFLCFFGCGTIAVHIFDYAPASIKWEIARIGFFYNLFIVLLGISICRSSPDIARNAIKLSFVAGTVSAFLCFVIYVLYLCGESNLFLHGLIYSSKAHLFLSEISAPRFSGFLKEPAELGWFLLVLIMLAAHYKNYFLIFFFLLVGWFSNSNVFFLLLSISLPIILMLRYKPNFLVPCYVVCLVAIVTFLASIKPSPEYFMWLDYLLPRANNLYEVRDVPQRLWNNWNAIQYFMDLGLPLGAGASYLGVVENDNFLFSSHAAYGAGAGVFKFLSDFSFFAIFPLIFLLRLIHKALSSPASIYMRAILFISLVFLSLRTGYYNIGVWVTCVCVYFGYIKHTIPKNQKM